MKTEHDMFAKAMSLAVHELRTPITVVSGYLRMVLKGHGGSLTDTQRKMLEEADRSCTRIGALVAEMSELGRLESDEVSLAQQHVDVAQLLSEVAADVHDGQDRGVRLQLRCTNPAVTVMGDRARLKAAVTAMVRSAVRQQAEPGVITIACSTATGQGGDWAVIAVGDETAIEPLIQHAGQATTSLDEWQGGLGLALPIARRVVERHGGALWSGGTRPFGGLALRLPSPGRRARPTEKTRASEIETDGTTRTSCRVSRREDL